MSTDFAPIVVFGFNRPGHLKNALVSLEMNPEAKFSELYIFIDGPRTASELQRVEECRVVAKLTKGFKNTILYFSESNLGLANSIMNGVSKVLKENDSVIVVEDDLEVSPNFLRFMNMGLMKYRDRNNVSAVHGYQYPIKVNFDQCVFLKGADCWGWATWRDRWSGFEPDGQKLLNQLRVKGLCEEFNLENSLKNSDLLENQIAGKIDSWAIRWHASMFLQNRMGVYPPESLVLNLGLDGSGTHEIKSALFKTQLSIQSSWIMPQDITDSVEYRKALISYFKSELNSSIKSRLIIKFRKTFKMWSK